jgi:Ras family protein
MNDTTSSSKERRILVAGSRSVGKTALTIQFTEERFVEDYNPTIESTHKRIFKHRRTNFTTNIIDTAGQDELSIFQHRHGIGIDGYVLVYSIANRGSFNSIRVLNDKIVNLTGNENIPRIIVGNKSDLSEIQRKVRIEEGEDLARELRCSYIECSAKTNEHIADIFRILLDKIEGTEGIPFKDEDKSSSGSTCILC